MFFWTGDLEKYSAEASSKADYTKIRGPFLEASHMLSFFTTSKPSTYRDFDEKWCQTGGPESGRMKGTPFANATKTKGLGLLFLSGTSRCLMFVEIPLCRVMYRYNKPYENEFLQMLNDYIWVNF